MKIKVGISNRHVHLTREVKQILFGNIELTKRNDLSQKGEYACNEVISAKSEKNEINNIRVMGPLRNYTQLEINKTDAFFLGLNPPVRNSGDLIGSESILLIGPSGTYQLKEGVIIASRHIHVSEDDINKYGFDINKKYTVKIDGEKGGTLNNISLKTADSYTMELHLNTDEANAFFLKNGDEVEIVNGGKNEINLLR